MTNVSFAVVEELNANRLHYLLLVALEVRHSSMDISVKAYHKAEFHPVF